MIAIATSLALHCGVFFFQPLSWRVASPKLQVQFNGGLQPVTARLIESTPVAVEPFGSTEAPVTHEIHQAGGIEAAENKPVAKKVNVWHPDENIRFYEIAEVDEPALPVISWLLPPELLSSIQLRHLVVQVWIAADGEILHATLLSSRPKISGEQQQTIEQSLIRTPMTPAVKNGRQVASQRTLEMALEF